MTATNTTEITPFKEYTNDCLHQHLDSDTEQTFTLIKFDTDEHFDLFHHWHNQKYVYEFWELEGSKEYHKKYLKELKTKDYIQPVIGYINETPCAYFEIYWAYYDRIAPYCDASLYDRGFHLLIGDQRYLGKHNTTLWLNVVCDFIFTDEPRTHRIVGEPRADNKGLLKYLEHTSFKKTKEFDFPHKRAALLECYRDQFYNEISL